eukprot:TRINITY_DN28511_c0_g1_i1.p1 TRINITY_DN28511_c0_g1~~TRINITY_DN28511_c0_g1_i1.p1  ORF type:complete len:394 (-),score=11.30 TRINITY_DN28511_c0_g1_i1:33-1214(-)
MASHEGRDPALFVKPVDQDLLCPICLSVLADPHDSPCGHTFCKPCIDKVLARSSPVCPECRSPITASKITPTNFRMRSMLGKLTTYCDNRGAVPAAESSSTATRRSKRVKSSSTHREPEGCQWEGEWSNLASHLENTCEFGLIHCSYNCSSSVQRRELEAHLKTCPLRPVKCGHCQSTMSLSGLGDHLQNCPELPVPCSCGNSMPRKHIDTHKSLCPDAEQACIFADQGCTTRPKRKDMAIHISSAKDAHLMHLSAALRRKDEQIRQLQASVDAIASKPKYGVHCTIVVMESYSDTQLFFLGGVQWKLHATLHDDGLFTLGIYSNTNGKISVTLSVTWLDGEVKVRKNNLVRSKGKHLKRVGGVKTFAQYLQMLKVDKLVVRVEAEIHDIALE